MGNWLRSRAERFGQAVPDLMPAHAAQGPSSASKATEDANRIAERLPRGADVIRDVIDRKERARWARNDEIARYRYSKGGVLLGKHAGELIGSADDRSIITVASARSGKTATVLKPTLLTYAGSMLILDPKGSLARSTARHREEKLGQRVYVVDPFEISGVPSSHFNALAELDPAGRRLIGDVDAITQALILKDSGSDSSHWTESAQALLRGLILQTLRGPEADRNLVTVREMLLLTYAPLEELEKQLEKDGTKNIHEVLLNTVFMEQAKAGDVFGKALAGAGKSFLKKNPRERASIVSTAETQTRFLDDMMLQAISRKSDFRLAELAEHPTTIYLCLPGGNEMVTHFRWLRLVLLLALQALERKGEWPRDKPRILFLLEEFAVLGHMDLMEKAGAYLPEFGVRPWIVLQSLVQLKEHYPRSWQTFLGNAAARQFFSNIDQETLNYISDELGSLSFVRGSFGAADSDSKGGSRDFIDKERLLYAHEARAAFERSSASQLLLMEGPPMAIERLSFADVERIERNAP